MFESSKHPLLDASSSGLGIAGSAEELIQQCNKLLPDVVIMDLSMPGMGGLEALKRLLAKWPQLKVIIFSIYSNPRLVKKVFMLGGLGYVTKSSEGHIILEAVNHVRHAKQYISPEIAVNLETMNSGTLYDLSAREFDIFRCISEGLGTKQISENLFLSEKTISVL